MNYREVNVWKGEWIIKKSRPVPVQLMWVNRKMGRGEGDPFVEEKPPICVVFVSRVSKGLSRVACSINGLLEVFCIKRLIIVSTVDECSAYRGSLLIKLITSVTESANTYCRRFAYHRSGAHTEAPLIC